LGFSKLLSWIFGLYIIGIGLSGIYFNWQYAQDHGFVQWLFLGEIVPTAKAFIWPYYASRAADTAQGNRATSAEEPPRSSDSAKPTIVGLTRHQTVRAEAKSLLLSLGYSQQASYLLMEDVHLNLLEHPKLKQIIALREQALEAAKSVDIEILESIYPGLGVHFRDEFMVGVASFLEGCRTYNNEAFITRKTANDKWADWYDANRKQIEVAVNSE